MAGGRVDMASFRRAAAARLRGALPAGWRVEDGKDLLQLRAVAPGEGGVSAQVNLDNFYRLYRRSGDLAGALRQIAENMRAMAEHVAGDGRVPWESASRELMVQLAGYATSAPEEAADPRLWLPGPFGLKVFPVLDRPTQLAFVSGKAAGDWGRTAEELVALGAARTRAALAEIAPVPVAYGPLAATFWDNDVPGYTATRLLFPDLIATPPAGDERVFVLAPDRDLVVAVRCAARDDVAALHLLWQVRVLREGYPRPVLPDTPLAMTPDGGLHPVKFQKPGSGLLIPLH